MLFRTCTHAYLRLEEDTGDSGLTCNEVVETIEKRVGRQSIWIEKHVDKADELRDFQCPKRTAQTKDNVEHNENEGIVRVLQALMPIRIDAC